MKNTKISADGFSPLPLPGGGEEVLSRHGNNVSHYFSDTTYLESKPQTFFYTYKSHSYEFLSDAGVFSAGKMDSGTEILLQNIPPLAGGSSLLDLGCGCGCIGIILAKEYSLKLTQSDINPRAVALTKENCEKNGVDSRVVLVKETLQNVGDAALGVPWIPYCCGTPRAASPTKDALKQPLEDFFDTITLNPPIHAGKTAVFSLYENAAARLKAGGTLYIVIRKKHGAESSIRHLSKFLNCEIVYKKKGVFVLACKKK